LFSFFYDTVGILLPLETDMYGAEVTKWGEAPKYVEMDDPLPPTSGEIQVNVSAVCLHSLVRARAKGVHYSVEGLPHTLGFTYTSAAHPLPTKHPPDPTLTAVREELGSQYCKYIYANISYK
jgi:hypothetical protein